MVLEACVICIDNSEWSRNGDFAPNRFDAQKDAANILAASKTNKHHENAVGILTMAGERVEVRVAPTNDMGKILSALHGVKIHPKSDFVRGILSAQLALKHRMNKNQKQRIVCFFGSPISASEKALEQIGKQLKKNNVALDIVSFGQTEQNAEKLKKLFEAVNSNDTSHLLECVVGSGELLSDIIIGSSLMFDADMTAQQSNEADSSSSAFTSSISNEFGVDPNIDPDLYMALRLSLEEEQARAQREQTSNVAVATIDSNIVPSTGAIGEDNSSSSSSFSSSSSSSSFSSGSAENVSSSTSGAASGVEEIFASENINDMDEELRNALLMSLQDYAGGDLKNGEVGGEDVNKETDDTANSNQSVDKQESKTSEENEKKNDHESK